MQENTALNSPTLSPIPDDGSTTEEKGARWILYLTPLEEQIWTYIGLNYSRIENGELRVGLFIQASDIATAWIRKGVPCTQESYNAVIDRFVNAGIFERVEGRSANGRKHTYRLNHRVTDFHAVPIDRRRIEDYENFDPDNNFHERIRELFEREAFTTLEQARSGIETLLHSPINFLFHVLLFGKDLEGRWMRDSDPLRFGFLRQNDAGRFICTHPGFEAFTVKQGAELPVHIGSAFLSGTHIAFLSPEEMGCDGADGPNIHPLTSCLFDEAGDNTTHDPLVRFRDISMVELEAEVAKLAALSDIISRQRELAREMLQQRRSNEQRRLELTTSLEAARRRRESALQALRTAEEEERQATEELSKL